jgi:hypothetical protein
VCERVDTDHTPIYGIELRHKEEAAMRQSQHLSTNSPPLSSRLDPIEPHGVTGCVLQVYCIRPRVQSRLQPLQHSFEVAPPQFPRGSAIGVDECARVRGPFVRMSARACVICRLAAVLVLTESTPACVPDWGYNLDSVTAGCVNIFQIDIMMFTPIQLAIFMIQCGTALCGLQLSLGFAPVLEPMYTCHSGQG